MQYGEKSYGIGLNLTRCYGYCHSPAEAVQMARFMQGDIDIPQDVWPLVSPSRTREAVAAQGHDPSDLYVIELSSAKELTLDGASIQLNYLYSAYPAFFADPDRAQGFWAGAEQEDRARVTDFLGNAWSATEEQRAEAAVLARVHLSMATRESLRRDLHRLGTLLPNVLIVSHVDARRPDGQPIGSRARFIELVTQEAAHAGLPFFDPSELMGEIGQGNAIEDDSTSFAHFTDAFSRTIMDEWMRAHIAPLTDNALRRDPSRHRIAALHAQVAAASDLGLHGQVQLRLERVQGEASDSDALLRLTTKSARDARAAFEARLEDLRDAPLEVDPAAELVAGATALGLFDAARRVADRAQGGATALPVHALMQSARRAADAEEWETAFAFARAALCANADLASARRMLVEIALDHPVAGFAELTDPEARQILAGLSPARVLRALGMQGLPLSLAISPQTTEADLAALVALLAERGRIDKAIPLIAAWRQTAQVERLRDTSLVAAVETWAEAALTLPDPLHRAEALTAIAAADPQHRGVRKAMQTLKLDLVGRVRAAGKAGKLETLDALQDEVALVPGPLPEYDLWRARLRYDRKDFGAALDLGQSAAQHLPESINVWVLLMRAALKSQAHDRVAAFAERVLALAGTGHDKLKAEAEAALGAAGVGA